jgi:hypothetical protein
VFQVDTFPIMRRKRGERMRSPAPNLIGGPDGDVDLPPRHDDAARKSAATGSETTDGPHRGLSLRERIFPAAPIGNDIKIQRADFSQEIRLKTYS